MLGSIARLTTLYRPGKKPIPVAILSRAHPERGAFGLDAVGVNVSVVNLPFPPPANNLYINARGGHGRYLSPRYREWQAEAAGMIKQQRPGRVFGPFRVEIVLTRPDKRKRDIDGLIKALLDALVKGGIVKDDSLAERVSIEWAPGILGAQLTISKCEAYNAFPDSVRPNAIDPVHH